MQMRSCLFAAFFMASFGSASAADKIHDPNAYSKPEGDEALTDEQVEFLDAIPSAQVDPNLIILPSGITLKEFQKKYPTEK